MAYQTVWERVKIGVTGPSAMKSLDKIVEEREKIKFRLTPEQILEVQSGMKDFEQELAEIVNTGLNRADLVVCSLFGMLTAFSAWYLDANGKKIEGFINDLTINDPATGVKITVKDFDTNNIFDIKRGSNHRVQLFHSGNIFKTAPADFIMPDGISLEELMGMGKSDYKLIELIIKKYGLSGGLLKQASGVLKIMGTHFLKDVVTPSGLPLPFSDIFTKFIEKPSNACGYSTKNLLYDGFLKEVNNELQFLNIRASDITSFALIQIFCSVYCKFIHSELDERGKKSLTDKMMVATSGFLMVSQLLMLCCGKIDSGSLVSGGKINPVVATMAIKNCYNVCTEANRNHAIIIDVYKKKRNLIMEVALNGSTS